MTASTDDLPKSNSGTLRRPQVSYIYRTLAGAIIAIVLVMWFLRLFIFADVPAARYTLLALIALAPTLAIALRAGTASPWMLATSLGAYIFVVTAGIHYGGGVDNVSGPLLYVLIIGLAGLLISERAATLTAVSCTLLYGIMVVTERHGILAHHLPYTKSGPDAVATVIAAGVYLFLIAWVVSVTVREIHSMHRRADALRAEAVSALSHDLRGPLGVIQNAAELAEVATGQDLQGHLGRIRRGARQALDLVNNVLDAAAIDAQVLSPAHAPVDLNRLISDIVDLYEPTAALRQIRVATLLAPDLPTVHADAQMLGRALGNLLSNALKFSDAGGAVEVATSTTPGRVMVAVRDSGPGIPLAEQRHLFERYSRTSSGARREGTGLGLYIVRSIIAAHGGGVGVESRVPQGTVFTVELPIG